MSNNHSRKNNSDVYVQTNRIARNQISIWLQTTYKGGLKCDLTKQNNSMSHIKLYACPGCSERVQPTNRKTQLIGCPLASLGDTRHGFDFTLLLNSNIFIIKFLIGQDENFRTVHGGSEENRWEISHSTKDWE